MASEMQQLSISEQESDNTHHDNAKRSLTFSPTPSRTSVYLDSDEEIEFDLPTKDFSYTEVLVSDEEFLRVKSIVDPDDIIYNASNIPVAPPSVPHCLSPPLKPLDATKRGKQAYHDAVAAKTNSIPRIASPAGYEKYIGLANKNVTPSPPLPPSGMCSLTAAKAKSSFVHNSNINTQLKPTETDSVYGFQSLAKQPQSLPLVRKTVPVRPTPKHNKPVVFPKELMDKIPDVTNLLVQTDQGFSITLPESHGKLVGNLITRKSFLPDITCRKPLSFYNILPNNADLIWIHTATGCSRNCYFMLINAENVVALVQDNFFVMRSNPDNFFLVFSIMDMTQLNKS